MLRTERWKYVHRYLDGRHELYDTFNDPQEVNNLYDEDRDTAERLKGKLMKWYGDLKKKEGEDVTGEVDEEIVKKMRTLGYF